MSIYDLLAITAIGAGYEYYLPTNEGDMAFDECGM